MKPVVSLSIITSVLLCLATQTMAHKLNVFVTCDSGKPEGEVYMTGGGSAKGITVIATDFSGKEIASTISDEQGQFSLDVAADQCNRVIARTVDGHQAEYIIKKTKAASPVAVTGDTNRERHSLDVKNIIGGIGWIIGIAGILFYLKARKLIKGSKID